MSLPRYRRPPIRQQGAITERKRPARRLAYVAVAKRARGRCELCGTDVERTGGRLDPHHVFRRTSTAGVPATVCELPELILGACRGCHDRIHILGDQALADVAELIAFTRYCETNGLDDLLRTFDLAEHGSFLDALREAVRQVEQREEAGR